MAVTPSRCLLCHHAPIEKWITKQSVQLYTCPGCSLGFRFPLPDSEELKKLYSEDLFGSPGRREYYLKDTVTARANARIILTLLKKHHPGSGSLFDAGCGFGHFLAEARDTGFEVSGCELSDFAASFARETYSLPVVTSDILQCPDSGPHDIVTLWDVLEHLVDPRAALERLSARLKHGGLLVLSTGDRDAFMARLMGKYWPIVNPRQHLYYFNGKSMDVLLEKCGLIRIETVYPTRFFNCRYLAMKAGENIPGTARIGALMQRLIPAGFRIPVNFRDIMTVFARKQERTESR
ncbi:class I SAM-dependent methyltransferase [bacterium]|nr:class I SAM-dependent methyltransferase [candidate division CSSED10-310 bacterium]